MALGEAYKFLMNVREKKPKGGWQQFGEAAASSFLTTGISEFERKRKEEKEAKKEKEKRIYETTLKLLGGKEYEFAPGEDLSGYSKPVQDAIADIQQIMKSFKKTEKKEVGRYGVWDSETGTMTWLKAPGGEEVSAIQKILKKPPEKQPTERAITSGEKARVSAGIATLENMGYTTTDGVFHLIQTREQAKNYLKKSKKVGIDIDQFPEYASYFEGILSAYDKLPEEARGKVPTLWLKGREGEKKEFVEKWKSILKKYVTSAQSVKTSKTTPRTAEDLLEKWK